MTKSGWLKAGAIGLGIDFFIGILMMIPCINCLVCPIYLVAWVLIPIGVGVMTAVWDKLHKEDINGAAMTLIKAALLYAGVGFVLAVVLALVQALLRSVLDISTATWSDENTYGIDSTAFSFFTTTVGTIVCSIIGFFIDLIIVMVAGIVTAAMREKKS